MNSILYISARCPECLLLRSLLVLGTALAIANGWNCAVLADEGKTAADLSSLSLTQLKAEIDARAKKIAGNPQHKDITDQRLMQEALARGGSKPIYGVDDRVDSYAIFDPKVKKRAAASVALLTKETLSPIAQGKFRVEAQTLGATFGLCPDERFAHQHSAAGCSGVLVREDTVVTAGHCVREVSKSAKSPWLADLKFVFGYSASDEKDSGKAEFAESQVFQGKQILGGNFLPKKQGSDDWAVVRLDRPVPKDIAEPVQSVRQTKIANDERLYVIGYPSGLPLKYAPGARVRGNSERAYFVANLDTFGGNSGSGVFLSETNELVGILVRGAPDYYADMEKGCARPFVCPSTGCDGEEVTRIEIVKLP